MPFNKESDMYPSVCNWLKAFLQSRHKDATVEVYDSSRKSLARLVQEKNFVTSLASDWPSWDIHVDITGFAFTEKTTIMAFIECKNQAINLGFVSQLLGYSKVAIPYYSFIVAPQGISDSLISLLKVYNRLDVIQYHNPKSGLPWSLVVARWDETYQKIDLNSIIGGGHIPKGKF